MRRFCRIIDYRCSLVYDDIILLNLDPKSLTFQNTQIQWCLLWKFFARNCTTYQFRQAPLREGQTQDRRCAMYMYAGSLLSNSRSLCSFLLNNGYAFQISSLYSFQSELACHYYKLRRLVVFPY